VLSISANAAFAVDGLRVELEVLDFGFELPDFLDFLDFLDLLFDFLAFFGLASGSQTFSRTTFVFLDFDFLAFLEPPLAAFFPLDPLLLLLELFLAASFFSLYGSLFYAFDTALFSLALFDLFFLFFDFDFDFDLDFLDFLAFLGLAGASSTVLLTYGFCPGLHFGSFFFFCDFDFDFFSDLLFDFLPPAFLAAFSYLRTFLASSMEMPNSLALASIFAFLAAFLAAASAAEFGEAGAEAGAEAGDAAAGEAAAGFLTAESGAAAEALC